MILPTKHITIENSIIGIGAEMTKLLNSEKTVSTLWDQAKKIKGIKSYGLFTLVLDFMFLIGIIEFKDGFLVRVK